MPLQDDTLREVWASDRSGSAPPHLNLPEPWGAQVEGLGKGRKRGGRQSDSFATLSGHEEEGSDIQQRPKQVCRPCLERRQGEPPTPHPRLNRL